MRTKKQAAGAAEQELGGKSARAMDLLSLAISKGREMKEQIWLIKLLTVQVEKKNRQKQAGGLTVGINQSDVITALEEILDGIPQFLQRMALFNMVNRFDIKGVDNDVFMEELARRLGGLPLNAKKSFARILNAVPRHRKHKLAS